MEQLFVFDSFSLSKEITKNRWYTTRYDDKGYLRLLMKPYIATVQMHKIVKRLYQKFYLE